MANGDWKIATALLLAAYAALLIFFVIRAARRTRSLSDYALGSQGFSPVVVGLSLAASVTSAATFIINPGFVAMFGWSAFMAMSLILPLGLIISLVILTRSFRRYGASVKALSLSQWMGKRYDSPALAHWFAVLSLLLLTFIVLICVGLTKVLSSALGADELWVLIGLVAVVFGYMMFGGANSMVYTNAIQAGLMLVVAAIMLTSGAEYFKEGLDGFLARLAAIDPMLTQATNPKSPLFRDWFEVGFCNFIVGVAIVCQPHIVTRSLMLRNEKDVNKYLLVGIVAQIIFFAVLFTGFYARLEFPDLTAGGAALKMDGIIPAYVVKAFPVYMGMLVVLGLLSAGLSTLEGLIQSLSITFTNDLVVPLSKLVSGGAEVAPSRLAWINKIVIIVMAVIAVGWSYNQLLHPNLSVGILAQNGVYAYFSAAFVPVLFGIYGKNVPKAAPIAASVTAIAVHFSVYYGALTPYTSGEVRNPAVAAALAILSAVAIGLIVVFLKKIKTTQVAATMAFLLFSTAAGAQSSDLSFTELPDGKKVAYLDRGKGDYTLLFIHGLGSNLKSWDKNIATLSNHYRCIAIDLPGYGHSTGRDYAYNMSFFADAVRAVIKKLKLRKVVLVGHSMGGQIALTEVLRNSKHIKKLVLLAPAGIETFTDKEKMMLKNVYTPEILMNIPEAQIRKNFEINFVKFPADAEFMIDDRLALRQTPAYADYCRMIPKCVAGMLDEPVFERLGQVKLPTLVIYGENDLLIPNRILHPALTTKQVAELARERIASSKMELAPASGHFVQWEGDAFVNEAIIRFLGK